MNEELPESFANYPETVGELRSDKDWNASRWTPRDVLINVLRRLDRGLKVDALVVSFRVKFDEGRTDSYFASAGPDVHVSVGLLMHTVQKIIGPAK